MRTSLGDVTIDDVHNNWSTSTPPLGVKIHVVASAGRRIASIGVLVLKEHNQLLDGYIITHWRPSEVPTITIKLDL